MIDQHDAGGNSRRGLPPDLEFGVCAAVAAHRLDQLVHGFVGGSCAGGSG
jgi:hypothetical protein